MSVATLGMVLVLTFLLLHCVPGGPFDQERQLPSAIEQNLYEKYGLTQRGDLDFLSWFWKDTKAYARYLAKGQLGPSLKYRDRDVREIISQAFWPSFQLGMGALVLALFAGVGLSFFSIQKPDGLIDKGLQMMTTLLVALPSFVVATLLVLIFSFTFKLLPPALWEGLPYQILPTLTLALAPLAYFFHLSRDGLFSEMKKDYVRTAQAKGLPPGYVIFKHAFKNAATPVVTSIGPMASYLVTGSFIVETIFSIPGLGRHFVTAVTDRDYFLVMGTTLLFGMILITLNALVDLSYLWLDPRTRKED